MYSIAYVSVVISSVVIPRGEVPCFICIHFPMLSTSSVYVTMSLYCGVVISRVDYTESMKMSAMTKLCTMASLHNWLDSE